MLLTVKERLLLLNILPREGDLSTIRIIAKLRASLSFSEEEHQALKFNQAPEGFTWEPSAPQTAEIDIGPKAQTVVRDNLDRLNSEKKLTEDYLPVWDKFNPDGTD